MSQQRNQQAPEDAQPRYQPGERSIREIINDLRQPLDDRVLATKEVKGTKITYIPWFVAVRALDHYAPGWSYEVRSIHGIGGKLIMVVRLTIPARDGVFYREASGQEDEDVSKFGDSSSNAESMALRRAAAKFGLGLYLYLKR